MRTLLTNLFLLLTLSVAAQSITLDSTRSLVNKQMTPTNNTTGRLKGVNWRTAFTATLDVAARTHQAGKIRVGVFGSSNQRGVGATALNGWTKILATRPSATHEFINLSIDGSKTTYWEPRIAGLIQQYGLDVVLFGVTIGNDVDGAPSWATGYQTWLGNIGRMANYCEQNGVRFIVATSVGRPEYGANGQKFMNDIYRQVGAAGPCLVVDHAASVDVGNGTILPAANADGLHLNDVGHTAWADMTPADYFRLGFTPATPQPDNQSGGVKVTVGDGVRPLVTHFGGKSFTFTIQIKKDTAAALGKALASFLTSPDDNLRLRVGPNNHITVWNSAGSIVGLDDAGDTDPNKKMTTQFRTITVRYNHITGQVALFVGNAKLGQAAWQTGKTISEVNLGSNTSGGGVSTGYSFRNMHLYSGALTDDTILKELHQGRVLKNSLVGFWPLNEGNTTFAGQIFKNLFPLPTHTLFSNQSE